MTTTGTGASVDPPLVDDDEGAAPRPTRRRRRPAPRAHPFWRFVFPVLVVAAGVAVFFVWRAGTKAVLDSTDGRAIEVITDPAAPGYVAFVDPTPTMMVAHVAGGDLVGVSVLARTALDRGGTLVLLSADMLVEPDDDGADGVLLSEAYRDGGIEAVEGFVADLFDFGFIETQLLRTRDLRGLLALVEPMTLRLTDPLIEVDDAGAETVFLAAGLQEVDAETAAIIYGWRNPDEAEVNRRERQLDLWEAWLREIAEAPEGTDATLPFDDGMSPFLRSLGLGTADLSLLPLEPIVFGDNLPLYFLDDGGAAWLRTKALDMVPLPVGSSSGARPTVRLLDGTGDPVLRDRLLPALVAAGAEVSIIGNATVFGITDTVVTYHVPENEAAAETLRAAIGATVRFDDDPSQPIDLTVVVGSDLEA